jgi:hypothetical protein
MVADEIDGLTVPFLLKSGYRYSVAVMYYNDVASIAYTSAAATTTEDAASFYLPSEAEMLGMTLTPFAGVAVEPTSVETTGVVGSSGRRTAYFTVEATFDGALTMTHASTAGAGTDFACCIVEVLEAEVSGPFLVDKSNVPIGPQETLLNVVGRIGEHRIYDLFTPELLAEGFRDLNGWNSWRMASTTSGLGPFDDAIIALVGATEANFPGSTAGWPAGSQRYSRCSPPWIVDRCARDISTQPARQFFYNRYFLLLVEFIGIAGIDYAYANSRANQFAQVG